MTCGAVIGAYGALAAEAAIGQSKRNQEAHENNMREFAKKKGFSPVSTRPAPEETGFPSPVDIATTFAMGELFNQVASTTSDSITAGGGTFDGGGASGDF